MRIILTILSLALLCAAGSTVAAEEAKTRVAILMFDGVQIIDFAAPYEVFGHAGFEVFTVSKDGAPVTTAMNLSVNVDHDFASAPRADIVVVPGGEVHEAMSDEATLAWIRERAAPAEHVLSICTGSFILANTGLLDGASATTFHQALSGLEAQFPEVTVVRDQRWVDTGKLVTSAGLASGMDAALHVVAEVNGVAAARTVAAHLEYDWSPDTGYVRGTLADQFIRWPEGLELPAGTEFDRVVSFGDRDTWRTEYRVESPLPPRALLDHFRGHAQADSAITVVTPENADTLAWDYRSDDARRWRITFRADEVEAGRYLLVSEIVARGATD